MRPVAGVVFLCLAFAALRDSCLEKRADRIIAQQTCQPQPQTPPILTNFMTNLMKRASIWRNRVKSFWHPIVLRRSESLLIKTSFFLLSLCSWLCVILSQIPSRNLWAAIASGWGHWHGILGLNILSSPVTKGTLSRKSRFYWTLANPDWAQSWVHGEHRGSLIKDGSGRFTCSPLAS